MKTSVIIKDPEEAKLIGPGPNKNLHANVHLWTQRKLNPQNSIKISMLLIPKIIIIMIKNNFNKNKLQYCYLILTKNFYSSSSLCLEVEYSRKKIQNLN